MIKIQFPSKKHRTAKPEKNGYLSKMPIWTLCCKLKIKAQIQRPPYGGDGYSQIRKENKYKAINLLKYPGQPFM